MYREIITEDKLKVLLSIAEEAGEKIMEIYEQDFDVNFKGDDSPVTQADLLSNDIINRGLKAHFDFPILSEENDDISYDERKKWEYLWVVDPLDGTKEFVNKRREFAVNIALVHNGKPVFGLIYAPVFKQMYYATKGEGTYKVYKEKKVKLYHPSTVKWQDKKIVHAGMNHIKVIMSRSHQDVSLDLDEMISPNVPHIQTVNMGSAVKFCRMAEGKVDIYLRNKPTCEWDTASGQIIVQEAGRKLYLFEDSSNTLSYNRENVVNQSFVVA